jgi:hypothetical protein
MCKTIQNGTANVGIMLSGSSSIISVVTSPRRIPMRELPLSTPPPIAPTKSSRPSTFSRTTCVCQPGERRAIARTTNGAYAPTMRSPIPAGHANVPGSKPNDMRIRNIAPMTRQPCIAVKRRRSRWSERVRTVAEKAYAIRNRIGGPTIVVSNAKGGWSGCAVNTPRTFNISESAAHAMTTNQTCKVLVMSLLGASRRTFMPGD